MISALFDANVLITYLLAPTADRPATEALRLGIERTFELVICDRSVAEVSEAIERKEHLARRIAAHTVHELFMALETGDHIVPRCDRPAPVASRDSDDNYLLAHAYHHRVDSIGTGDKDYLSLGSPSGIHIVKPREFLILLNLES